MLSECEVIVVTCALIDIIDGMVGDGFSDCSCVDGFTSVSGRIPAQACAVLDCQKGYDLLCNSYHGCRYFWW